GEDVRADGDARAPDARGGDRGHRERRRKGVGQRVEEDVGGDRGRGPGEQGGESSDPRRADLDRGRPREGAVTDPLILVVDDDAASRRAMALTLQTDGKRVEEFVDADSALTRASEDPFVALVVTDLKMPGKTGLDLATELAAARPDVSILLVTAHGDVETLLAARDLGTVDYVAKPVAKDDLRLRATAALTR